MDNATKILVLKKKLSEEIQKENSNNNVILALSSEIAKLDDSQVRFSVDAGIINRLGKYIKFIVDSTSSYSHIPQSA
mgnify:CR=1 FL=1